MNRREMITASLAALASPLAIAEAHAPKPIELPNRYAINGVKPRIWRAWPGRLRGAIIWHEDYAYQQINPCLWTKLEYVFPPGKYPPSDEMYGQKLPPCLGDRVSWRLKCGFGTDAIPTTLPATLTMIFLNDMSWKTRRRYNRWEE